MISGGVAKKRTAVHTTKKGLLDELLPHECTKDHDHVHLEGSDPITGRRTSFAENYPEKMCKIIADGLLSKEVKTVIYYTVGDDDESFHDESINTLEDDEKEQAIYQHRKMVETHGSNIVKYIERLHRNLGHPRLARGHCMCQGVHVQGLPCTAEAEPAPKGIAAQGDYGQRHRADGLLQGCPQDRKCHSGTHD